MTSVQVAAAGFAVLVGGASGAVLWRILTIGQRAKSLRHEPLNGEIGVATSALNPEGWVRLRDALHRASSSAPVAAGARVIVVQSRFPLEVRPL
jgi:membrane-bound ClpP family serine protease